MYFQRSVASILGVCWFLLLSLIFRQFENIFILLSVTIKLRTLTASENSFLNFKMGVCI